MANDFTTNPIIHSNIGAQYRTDFKRMLQMAGELIALAEKKDAEYGSAWKRRGGQGAFFQGIARKWDRLETQLRDAGYNIFDVTVEAEVTESLDETMRDLVNYLLLTLETREGIRAEIAKEVQRRGQVAQESLDE